MGHERHLKCHHYHLGSPHTPQLAVMSFSPLIPPALASHARRQRSNAISRARESSTDAPDSPSPTSSTTSSPTSPWRDDELICPLALDTAQQHTHTHVSAKPPSWIPVPIWPSNEGELQAVLAQFTFPTSASGRKHRRSGEIIADDSTPSSASAGKRGVTSGPTRRTLCSHCERGRSSA